MTITNADYIVLDDETYNVPILSMTRTADFLDKYAERTLDGNLNREIIGVYFNYQIAFGKAASVSEYARLWEKLTEPKEFHTVRVPDENNFHEFTAYFASVKDQFVRVSSDGVTRWMKGLTVNFIARTPARS